MSFVSTEAIVVDCLDAFDSWFQVDRSGMRCLVVEIRLAKEKRGYFDASAGDDYRLSCASGLSVSRPPLGDV